MNRARGMFSGAKSRGQADRPSAERKDPSACPSSPGIATMSTLASSGSLKGVKPMKSLSTCQFRLLGLGRAWLVSVAHSVCSPSAVRLKPCPFGVASSFTCSRNHLVAVSLSLVLMFWMRQNSGRPSGLGTFGVHCLHGPIAKTSLLLSQYVVYSMTYCHVPGVSLLREHCEFAQTLELQLGILVQQQRLVESSEEPIRPS